MARLQIIYTPEADRFRLDDVEMWGRRPLGNAASERLRANYEKLKKEIPGIPEAVGIATYDKLLKYFSREFLSEIEKPTTTYAPLDILEKAARIREEDDLSNPVHREHAYRTLGYLFMHNSIYENPDPDIKRLSRVGPAIPAVEDIKRTIQELRDFFNENKEAIRGDEYAKDCDTILKNFERYPTFQAIENAYASTLRRFEANGVSRSLPLYFLPGKYSNPSLFSVSLIDEIEMPESVKKTLEYLELGSKSAGLKEIPEDMKNDIMSLRRDRFGETKKINSLDLLLKGLPQPQTIITDLYAIDCFPELQEIGFEPHEFRPE